MSVFSFEDEKMLSLMAMLNNNINLIQGPVAIMNIFPWLYLIMPTYFQNKLLGMDALTYERDQLVNYFKVSNINKFTVTFN